MRASRGSVLAAAGVPDGRHDRSGDRDVELLGAAAGARAAAGALALRRART